MYAVDLNSDGVTILIRYRAAPREAGDLNVEVEVSNSAGKNLTRFLVAMNGERRFSVARQSSFTRVIANGDGRYSFSLLIPPPPPPPPPPSPDPGPRLAGAWECFEGCVPRPGARVIEQDGAQVTFITPGVTEHGFATISEIRRSFSVRGWGGNVQAISDDGSCSLMALIGAAGSHDRCRITFYSVRSWSLGHLMATERSAFPPTELDC